MQTGRVWVNDYFLKAALVALVLWLLAFALAYRAFGETICVVEPIMPQATQAEKQAVRDAVVAAVVKKSWVPELECTGDHLELMVEPIAAASPDGTYITAEWAASSGFVSATVRTSPVVVRVSGWMVTIFPKQGLHLTRRREGNLTRAVSKAVGDVQRQRQTDGKRS